MDYKPLDQCLILPTGDVPNDYLYTPLCQWATLSSVLLLAVSSRREWIALLPLLWRGLNSWEPCWSLSHNCPYDITGLPP